MLAAVQMPKMYAATTPTDKIITAQHENKHAIACRTKILFYTPKGDKELILSCNIDVQLAVGMGECTGRLLISVAENDKRDEDYT